MDHFFETNRELWNAWAQAHRDSEFYGLKAFCNGKSSLNPLEIKELGPVENCSILHLQCHFGMDSLSLARMGAQVTGADFSPQAIKIANDLSQQLEIPASFIESNVYDLPKVLKATFDRVFTSYGVLCWLPNLDQWAALIANYLKPGGFLYMVEFHPLTYCWDDNGKTLRYPYFRQPEPLRMENQGSYGSKEDKSVKINYEWPHSLGEVVTALLNAGLALEFLHEHSFSSYDCWPFLAKEGPSAYVHRDHGRRLPLMYSLKARKPA